MSIARLQRATDLQLEAALVAAPPAVDIVVPVYNEAAGLATSIARLYSYLVENFPFTFRITIADNGSTDGTWELASDLASRHDQVRAVRLDESGRGRALHAVWSTSDAEVLAYMDVDLSTGLSALLPLVAPLLSGHSDLAIGSRLARGARVRRGPKREVISRIYNRILHTVLGARFSDAQCGFKAIRADRARALLPLVEDRAWFFDTELLVLAERSGLRIHEVPVDWVEDPDSRVDIVATAVADLRGVLRLARGRVPRASGFTGQVMRFAGIGVVSTFAYIALFAALRGALPPQAANALALLVTAVLNTAANRHFTFAIHHRRYMLRHQLQGLLVFALALALTSGTLAGVHALIAQPTRVLEIVALTLANLLATILRFTLLRSWVFNTRRVAPELD
jgi:glycosyltransferase involved in cell wall biosynthesis